MTKISYQTFRRMQCFFSSRRQVHSAQHRIARGAVLSGVSSAVNAVMTLSLGVICARLLGRQGYGELSMVLSTSSMFTAVGSCGLSITTAKHIAQYKEENRSKAGEVAGVSLLISACIGLLCALIQISLAPMLAKKTLHAPMLGVQLQIAALIVLFSSLNTAQTGVLQGFEAFHEVVRQNLLRGAITLASVIVGSRWGGLPGAIFAYALSNFLFSVLLQRAILKICRANEIQLQYFCSWREVISLLGFSLAVLVSAIALVPANWWATAQLATRTGFGQVGIFTAMYQWQSAILFISNAVIASSLPVLTSLLSAGDIHEYTKQIRRVFLITSISGAAIAIPLALFSGWIVQLYGKDFRGAATTLVVICVFGILNAAGAPVGTLLWSTGSTRAGVILSIIGGLSLLIFATLFTGQGAMGLAFAYLCLSCVQVISGLIWWVWWKPYNRLSVNGTSSS